MTEKRYRTFAYNDGSGMWGINDDVASYTIAYFDNHIGAEHLCELLNALHEENQKLLTLNNMKKGALVEAVKDLTDENEQLKQIISNYEKAIDKVFDNIVFADKNAIQSLKKQLKMELQE